MRQGVAVVLFVALAAQAAEEKKPATTDQDNFFERAVKAIGKDAKGAAHQAGQSYSKAGKDIGHAASKTVHDVGHAMKDSAHRTGKEVRNPPPSPHSGGDPPK